MGGTLLLMAGWIKKQERGGGQVEELINIHHICKYVIYTDHSQLELDDQRWAGWRVSPQLWA